MDLISAESVSKSFGGIHALRDASFAGRAGEVHALLGENGAGKSTFIQILTGALRPDGGRLLLSGRPYEARSPSEGQEAGVSAVFQELSLVPDLSVAQNIWFRFEPRTVLGTIRSAALHRMTEELFQRYNFPPIDPSRPVRALALAQRQVVEIAKALSRNPKVLILDEATSALPARETAWLLGLVRDLARSGTLVIFISHRMAEIREIANRITVFRNGRTVASYTLADVTDEQIVADMLGRRLERLFPERHVRHGRNVALRVRGLNQGHNLRGVDLDLHEGEILGVSGLQGHGQRELFLSLFGALPAQGEMALWGRPFRPATPRQALRSFAPVALVPEDRRHEGLLLSKSVEYNLTLSVVPLFARLGVIDRSAERRLVSDIIARLQIKTQTPGQLAGTLSGGNQQKVVFGKMLLTRSKILLLYDPTRGVDVGTKSEIFELMRQLADEGYAILFYSSDLTEIINVAHRVAVMQRGRIASTLERDSMTEDRILSAAMSGTTEE